MVTLPKTDCIPNKSVLVVLLGIVLLGVVLLVDLFTGAHGHGEDGEDVGALLLGVVVLKIKTQNIYQMQRGPARENGHSQQLVTVLVP